MASYDEIVEGADFKIVLKEGVVLPFQRIPAGEFRMGARGYSANEEPLTRVVIPEDFYLGTFAVTQEQFAVWTETVEGVGNYRFWLVENKDKLDKTDRDKHQNYFVDNPRHPAEQLSWYEAVGFCEWLNVQSSHPEGMEVRLPAMAEWEYACRAGTETEYYSGDGEEVLKQVAWFGEEWDKGSTHVVGEKVKNKWGLFDVHGNVWEWCKDRFDGEASRKRACGDVSPPKLEDDADRVLRGGSWVNSAWGCRSACRGRNRPGGRNWGNGLRVGLFPGPPAQEQAPGAELGAVAVSGGTERKAEDPSGVEADY